jgi:hypothetical protein
MDKASKAPTEGSNKKSYEGDLAKTKILHELFEVTGELRDENWKTKFLANVTDASFACGDPQVIEGPDGFPYFQINIPEPGKEFQCFVLRHMKDDFLLERGWGVVINASKGEPDWVFSYGDIVNYHLMQEFYSQSQHWNLPKEEVIQEEEQALVGQPSESVLPPQTRAVLRDFLISLGITDCKVLLMNRRKSGPYLQELVFNLTPDKFQRHEHYEAVMRSIAWYLPRHYSYVSMHESSMGENFKLL